MDPADFFWHGGFLQPILHCVIKEIRVTLKIRIRIGLLPSGTVPNFGLRNFRHGNSTVLPTNFVDGRAYILIAQKIAHTHTNENKSKRHDS